MSVTALFEYDIDELKVGVLAVISHSLLAKIVCLLQ